MQVFSAGGGAGGIKPVAQQFKMRGTNGNTMFSGGANTGSTGNNWKSVITFDGKFLLLGLWHPTAIPNFVYEYRFVDKDSGEIVLTFERQFTGLSYHDILGLRMQDQVRNANFGGFIIENLSFQVRSPSNYHDAGNIDFEAIEVE